LRMLLPIQTAKNRKSDSALVTVSMGLRRIWLHDFFDFIAASFDARNGAEIRHMKVAR
jgi:hypothetical protein